METKPPTITGQMAANGRFPSGCPRSLISLSRGGSLPLWGAKSPQFQSLRWSTKARTFAVEPRKLRRLRRGFTEQFQAGAVRLVLEDATTVGRVACSF